MAIAACVAGLAIAGTDPALASDAPPEDVAARATPAVRVFNDKDGLPQNSIVAQALDADGRLWVGTQEGLAVYDGVAFRRVALPEESRSGWITALTVLADRTVVVGTHADGVWLLKDGRFEHVTKATGLPDDKVTAVTVLRPGEDGGELWVGTHAGVGRRARGAWSTLTGTPFDGLEIGDIARGDGFGVDVWVGAVGVLAHRANGAWSTYRVEEGTLPHPTPSRLYVSAGGPTPALWAGFRDSGLQRLEGARWSPVETPCDDVRAITETPAGQGATALWVATSCGGLERIEGARRSILDRQTSRLPSDFVVSLMPTRAEQGPPALWVGTDGGGLARVLLGGWRTLDGKTSAVDGPVYAYGWSGGAAGETLTWIGLQTGLLRHDGRTWSKVPLPDLAPGDQYVNAIVDARGERQRGLWVATFGGVSRLRDGAWRTYSVGHGELPARIALTLFEASDGRGGLELFAGLRKGLARFDGERWSPVTEPGAPSDAEVSSITETSGPAQGTDREHVLWVATTDAGLFRRDHAGWTRISGEASPVHGDEVLQVHPVKTPSGRERLFVSTGEAGLAWVDPADGSPAPRWSRLSTRTDPPLPDDVVYGVAQDRRGRIYACTNHGVARLVPRGEDAYDVDVFRTEDGLPSDECNTGGISADPRGRIWVGTVGGAAVFEPDEAVDDRVAKRLLLRETRLFADAFDLAHTPDLTYEQSTLTFALSLVSYHREEETRFRTQLVGLEREPSPWTHDDKIRYTSLPPGDYELKAWGRDYAGNVSGPLGVAFRVHPPPWRTWWAYGAYAVLAASAIAFGVRMREATLVQRATELESGIAERTEKLASMVRELDRKNSALQESQERANQIFSAFADVLPGAVLDGKYRVEERIGTGGFGAVFRAEQLALGRKVAVKVFQPMAGNDSAAALERFRREGISACRVNHPNAIQVFDSGISGDGIPYIVMELLDGHTVKAELERRGSLPLGRALSIAIPVCDALTAAHEAGIVHRDIKPDNIFLQRTKDGEVVKLLDFGIAKLLKSDDELQTASAALIGTPRYMAPERLAHDRVEDTRGDVYSLGVALYEMISGHAPWARTDDVFALVSSILAGGARSLSIHGVPGAVPALVDAALARTPEARPTAAELARRLRAAQAALSPAALEQVYGSDAIDPGGPTLQVHPAPGTGSKPPRAAPAIDSAKTLISGPDEPR